MAYGRIVSPRIYTCTMRHLLARGAAASSWSQIGATPALNIGSSVSTLVGVRPGQRCSFDTSGGSTHLVLQFDMGISTGNPINFVAILNHNLAQAGAAEPTLRHNTVAFTGAGEGTAVTPLVYPWGGVETGVMTENGVFGFTFAPVTNKRYWALEIPDDSTFTSTDLEMGLIMIGSTYDFPYSPDLEITCPREFDGVKGRESVGGQGWSSIAHLGGPGDASTIFGQPFRVNGADYRRRLHSRRSWDVTFSRLEDTQLAPSATAAGLTACASMDEVWERTLGPHLPFIWQPDTAQTGTANMGDSAFCRWDMDEFTPKQSVAPRIWNYRLRIREDF